MAARQLKEDSRAAGQRLDDVCECMSDYTAIVEEWAVYEERKIKEARERSEVDGGRY